MKVFIVTGISQGLGKDMADILIQNKSTLIGIGRSFTNSQIRYSEEYPELLSLINCDLSNLDQVKSLDTNMAELITHKTMEIVYINNAGVISPIEKVGHIKEVDSIVDHVNVNYLSGVLLTNILIKNKADHTKVNIINISSGASERPIEGWSLYCSSKKAYKMFLDVVKIENPTVMIHHVDPGVMDTSMQQKIRSMNEKAFPLVEQFANYEVNNQLRKTNEVAREILRDYIQ